MIRLEEDAALAFGYRAAHMAALAAMTATALTGDPETAEAGEAVEGLGVLARQLSDDLLRLADDMPAAKASPPPGVPYPKLLRGMREIGDHLGMSAKQVQHLHLKRSLPTLQRAGCPMATTTALDDWKRLVDAGVLRAV